jgi:ADP-heptose:LPS heptosyltransferase
MRNVLIILLRFIGDVLLATPAARAIKVARPDVRVTMMVNRGTEEVLSGNPYMDEIIILSRRKFDLSPDCVAGDSTP